MSTTPRWVIVVWVIGGLLVGLALGMASGRLGSTCSTETKDGGMTITETCTRDLSP